MSAESKYSKSIVVEARAGDPRDIPAYTAAPMRGTPRARSARSAGRALRVHHASRDPAPPATPARGPSAELVTLTAGGAAVGPPAPRAARIRSRIPRILDYRTVRERLNQIRTTTGTRPSAARPARSRSNSLDRMIGFANVNREAGSPNAARRAARSRRRGSAEPVDPPRRRGDVRSLGYSLIARLWHSCDAETKRHAVKPESQRTPLLVCGYTSALIHFCPLE